jgi:hypothetical protein
MLRRRKEVPLIVRETVLRATHFLLILYSLQPLVAYVNYPKALVASHDHR